MKKTLVVLAAGMGSRFGGLKQIEPVGPNGEFIIDYSIYDAIRCGFEKVVFIIKEEHYEIFKETIGKRIEPFIKTEYAFQKLEDIPVEIDLKKREKPLGTGHALYAARELIDGNFAIMNADDFYGYEAIRQISEFLDKNLVEDKERYGLVAYKARNTITENGSVKRGVCLVENNTLVGLDESLIEEENGKLYRTSFKTNEKEFIEDNTPVSMNLLGFPKEFLDHIIEDLPVFLKNNKDNIETCEFLFPDVVSEQVEKGTAMVEIIETNSKWYGMTYKDDKEEVITAIKEKIESKEYKNNLWEK